VKVDVYGQKAWRHQHIGEGKMEMVHRDSDGGCFAWEGERLRLWPEVVLKKVGRVVRGKKEDRIFGRGRVLRCLGGRYGILGSGANHSEGALEEKKSERGVKRYVSVERLDFFHARLDK
jgi:hypothetical protein